MEEKKVARLAFRAGNTRRAILAMFNACTSARSVLKSEGAIALLTSASIRASHTIARAFRTDPVVREVAPSTASAIGS